MNDYRILQGTATKIDLPDKSVHCVTTSPPYWGLRAYSTEPQVWDAPELPCTHDWVSAGEIVNRGGNPDTASKKQRSNTGSIDASRQQAGFFCSICGAWKGELGSEPTPELYVKHIVQVFREVKRVLRDDGTLWINLGVSYAGSGKGGGGNFQHNNEGSLDAPVNRQLVTGYKNKDLIDIPGMVFEALRQGGWYRRAIFPWIKPNGMPGSQGDRPTENIEWFGLFSKKEHYYYDQEAVKLPAKYSTAERKARVKEGQKSNPTDKISGMRAPVKGAEIAGDGQRFRRASDFFLDSLDLLIEQEQVYLNQLKLTRKSGLIPDHAGNPLAIIMATGQSDESHYATYDVKLILPMIKASTSEKGVCPKCGAPWERIVQTERYKVSDSKIWSGANMRNNAEDPRTEAITTTLGWEPSCKHKDLEPTAATVFDPFNGTGTTGAAALQLGRAYIGQELKDEYIAISVKRLNRIAPSGSVETKKGEVQMALNFGAPEPKPKRKPKASTVLTEPPIPLPELEPEMMPNVFEALSYVTPLPRSSKGLVPRPGPNYHVTEDNGEWVWVLDQGETK